MGLGFTSKDVKGFRVTKGFSRLLLVSNSECRYKCGQTAVQGELVIMKVNIV